MPDTQPTVAQVFPVRAEVAARAHVTAEGYRAMYERAERDPDGFWAEEAKRVAWMKPPTKIKNTSFTGDVSIKWFEDGTLNASASCLDRHLATRGEQTAIIWEGDDPAGQPAHHLSRTARAGLPPGQRDEGPGRQARATASRIYLPMVPEAAVAMLACARIGAIHSVVFGGFSPDSLANRHPGLRLHAADHRRRGPARRAQGAAEGQCRRGAEVSARA